MKSFFLKRICIFLIMVLALISFLINPPTSVAVQNWLEIDKDISLDGTNWVDDLDQVFVGTSLYYRITAFTPNITSTIPINISLIDSFFSNSVITSTIPVGGVITTTLTTNISNSVITSTIPSNGGLTITSTYGPITSTLGTMINTISGTIAINGNSFFGTDSASYTAAVPEPTTMILLASGLLGLVGLRKKLKR